MLNDKQQREEIERLLAQYDIKIAAAFEEGLRKITDSVTLKQIADMIEAGHIQGAIGLFNNALINAGFVTFAAQLTAAMMSGGNYAQTIANANRIVFGFRVGESNTARFMENYVAERVRQISMQMRETISQVIYREVSAGTNPIDTARLIKQNLGLTATQEKAVNNYRKYLEDGDRRALERALRDKRYDPTVSRLIRTGGNLKPEQIDKMVSRYRQRFIKRRAENIARTESMTMLNAGNQKYWEQAVKSGIVRQNQIVRTWKHSHDSKVRSSHIQIPGLNPDGRGLNEPFKSPLGNIRYPGDPAASGANRINCRCYIFTRIISDE